MMNQERWKIIEEVYQSAFDLEGDERVAFLDKSCGDDKELRTEVESLLSQTDEEDRFLDKPAFTLGISLLASRQSEQLTGKTVGHYKVLKEIGRGGMGEVYLAEDPRLERLVALKVLPSYITEQENIQRFQQEARAASAISHPNVAHIYEAGIENNVRFIAMEYVEGVTLREVLKQKTLDVTDALEIALQIASALSAAHEAGVVHRDIKPENITLRPDGYVKVLDFGLAKLSEPQNKKGVRVASASSSFDTTPGVTMGTTAYMSPEQVRGLYVNALTDVWSLGVVLYEMLAGQKPFDGETPSDISAAILLKEPAQFSFSFSNENERNALTKILIKALQKDATNRYKSANAFANDLKQVKQSLDFNRQPSNDDKANTAGHSSSQKAKTSSFAQTSKSLNLLTTSQKYWRKQNLTLKILFISVSFGVLITAIFISANYLKSKNNSQAVQPNNIDSLTVLPFDNETGDADVDFLCMGLADDTIRTLGKSGNIRVISLASSRKAKEQKLDNARIVQKLFSNRLLKGNIKKENGSMVIEAILLDLKNSQTLWQDKFNTHKEDLLKLRNVLTTLLTTQLQGQLGLDKHILISEYPTSNNEAYKAYLEGKYTFERSNVAGIKKSIASLERAVSLDPKYTLAYIALAEFYNLLGTFMGQSPDYFQLKAKETLLKALKIDNNMAEAHTLLGKIKMDFEHDWLGCESEFKRAIEINPNYSLAHHWYGEVYLSAMKRLDESINELKLAHKLDPLSSGIITAIAWSYIGKGDYQQAIDECNFAFETNPKDTGIYEYRAKAFFKLGRFNEAIQDAQKIFELDPTARYLATLGVFYALSGNPTKAREILQRLQADKSVGAVSKYDFAIVHGALGERDEAFRLLNEEINSNSVDLLSILIDPLLDELRNDARFTELEQKFNFPEVKP